MKELLSYLFPFFAVCLILFVVTRIWVALVDTVIGWGKRLLHLEGGENMEFDDMDTMKPNEMM